MIIPQKFDLNGKGGRPMIVQGATFDWGINYKDDAGVAINLTGWTARMKIRDTFDATPIISLTTGSGITITGATGRIDVVMTATQTAAITVPGSSGAKAQPTTYQYIYDLEIEDSAGFVGRLLYGTITVQAEVTY